jgi:EAL domain-containing protein (putative c-di-GMP-specific phosphodiesterase class I)
VRLASERDEFTLHYQPVITLSTGRMDGVEALLRWKHPELGLVSPDEFISIAEETGAIAGITDWVVRAACAQIVRWRSELGNELTPQMSVNISGLQLSSPGLAEHLARITREYGLGPEMICLEITESAIMRDRKAAVAALTTLKNVGFRLTLDDFGAGSSSLSTLHEFPLDVVKLDRSMIAGMSLGRQHTALLQAVISLADNLRLTVVAEGVETADQLATLEALDCRFAQGRLFGAPVPAWEIMGTLLTHRRAA